MAETTTMRAELQGMVRKLAAAGVPVDEIAREMIAQGTGILAHGLGHAAAGTILREGADKVEEIGKTTAH
jgi:hypothetical protein